MVASILPVPELLASHEGHGRCCNNSVPHLRGSRMLNTVFGVGLHSRTRSNIPSTEEMRFGSVRVQRELPEAPSTTAMPVFGVSRLNHQTSQGPLKMSVTMLTSVPPSRSQWNKFTFIIRIITAVPGVPYRYY
eukprot:SAG11_NODE_114_length_16040_cov_10.050875_3_plen_133_part_00